MAPSPPPTPNSQKPVSSFPPDSDNWSFILTQPNNNFQNAFLKDKPIQIIGFSPFQNKKLNYAFHERTPFSPIDKANIFSPFRTTCQKRPDSSPFSPGLWKNLDSSLKKRKQFAVTPFEALFDFSQEKDSAERNKQIHITPMFEPLLFENQCLNHSQTQQTFPDFPKTHIFHSTDFFPQEKIQSQTKNNPKRLSFFPSQGKENANRANESDPQEGCNCRSTGCLKFYCQCLRSGKTCINCNCVGCENHPQSKIRKDKVAILQKKHPEIFSVKTSQIKEGKVRSCNCRKSHCKKNYCECHQAGARCGKSCKCFECNNAQEGRLEMGEIQKNEKRESWRDGK